MDEFTDEYCRFCGACTENPCDSLPADYCENGFPWVAEEGE